MKEREIMVKKIILLFILIATLIIYLIGTKLISSSPFVIGKIPKKYPTLEEAIEDRLTIYLGSIGRYFSPLLTWQLQPQLGFGIDALKPIEQLSKVTSAVLLIAGENDQHTTLKESKMMFQQLHEPKELWIVPNAKHVDFDALLGEEYKKRILRFLNREIAI